MVSEQGRSCNLNRSPDKCSVKLFITSDRPQITRDALARAFTHVGATIRLVTRLGTLLHNKEDSFLQ
jgi:hypothetical protein